MKKQKPNRAKQKNRKFIPGTKAYYRRKYTQFMQRESRKEGILSPRCLARSVGCVIGSLGAGISPAKAAANFRTYADAAIKVPLYGTNHRNKRILNQKVRKLQEGAAE